MTRPQAPHPRDEAREGRRRAGKLGLRLLGLGAAGAITGWLSGRSFNVAMEADFMGGASLWLPGVIYGLLWLAVAWVPGTLVVRERGRRSWLWTAGFLLGMGISFAAAYETASRVASFLTENHATDLTVRKLMISGFLGGIPGTLGLACMLGLLFRGFDGWLTRSILTACGAGLGVALGLWDLDQVGEEGPMSGLILFFIIWQGGMAVAIVASETVEPGPGRESSPADPS